MMMMIEKNKKGILSRNILFYFLKKYGFYLYFTIRYYESKIFEEEVAEIPNLRGRCTLVWHKVHISDNPEDSKLCPQGTISFFSLMPCSSDTLGRNFTEFGTGVQCNKDFQKMKKIGVKKLGGVKNLNFRNFILIISERIMTKYIKLDKKWYKKLT